MNNDVLKARDGLAGDGAEMNYSVQPEEIREILRLKRLRPKHYFVFSVLCLVISFFLFFVFHIGDYLFFCTFLIGFVATPLYGSMVLMAGKTGRCWWEIDKILVTTTGIALQDYHGKIRYLMPFARVRNIRYSYLTNVLADILFSGHHTPTGVQFELDDGKWFGIAINTIVRADQEKIFRYLPAWRK
jgi:hypothetical protein